MSNKLIFGFLLMVAFFSNCKQSDPLPTKYDLVWADDFSGTSLDLSKWEYMLGDGSTYGLYRWGNNEEQYYRKENVTVSGGFLKIKAIAENFGGLDYTSGRIRSLNKGDFKYGKIETSIRMSNVGGLWHAFWMLPSNPSKGWPISGEIDIMEYVGFDKFTLEVKVQEGRMEVILNDNESVVYDDIHIQKWSVFENYFKAGNYLSTKDEGAFSRVKYYELEVSH